MVLLSNLPTTIPARPCLRYNSITYNPYFLTVLPPICMTFTLCFALHLGYSNILSLPYYFICIDPLITNHCANNIPREPFLQMVLQFHFQLSWGIVCGSKLPGMKLNRNQIFPSISINEYRKRSIIFCSDFTRSKSSSSFPSEDIAQLQQGILYWIICRFWSIESVFSYYWPSISF